jgi:sec-independent protein translocase protein TatB
MFDFAWSEIVLIGVVALIAIGPKDLPVAMRAAARVVKKARAMAAEFQTHVDDMLRDADLREMRDNINQLRSLNLRSQMEQAMDPDGALRRSFAANPLAPRPAEASDATQIDDRADHAIAPPFSPSAGSLGPAPAFIPPEAAAAAAPAPIPPVPVPAAPAPPAFVPPEQAAKADVPPPADAARADAAHS